MVTLGIVDLTPDIERVLSSQRLSKYRAAAPDETSAWRLYRMNLDLGAAWYPLIADAEIALRNTVNQKLGEHYERSDWWAHETIVLDEATLTTLRGIASRVARSGLGTSYPGNVIAQTSLGMWVSLLGRGGRTLSGQTVSYETQLWRPALRHGFAKPVTSSAAAERQPTRRDVYRRARVLQRLRNRVAHHEPIFDGVPSPGERRRIATAQAWSETVELLEWMCPDLAEIHLRDRRVPVVLERHQPSNEDCTAP